MLAKCCGKCPVEILVDFERRVSGIGVLVRPVVSPDKPDTCSIGIIIVTLMKLWNYLRRIIVSTSMLSRKTGSDMRIGSVSTSLLTRIAGGTASLILAISQEVTRI